MILSYYLLYFSVVVELQDKVNTKRICALFVCDFLEMSWNELLGNIVLFCKKKTGWETSQYHFRELDLSYN